MYLLSLIQTVQKHWRTCVDHAQNRWVNQLYFTWILRTTDSFLWSVCVCTHTADDFCLLGQWFYSTPPKVPWFVVNGARGKSFCRCRIAWVAGRHSPPGLGRFLHTRVVKMYCSYAVHNSALSDRYGTERVLFIQTWVTPNVCCHLERVKKYNYGFNRLDDLSGHL